MLLKRFRNELIVILAIIFALLAFFYKINAKAEVINQKSEIENSISEISRVSELKKLWTSKQIAKDATLLQTIVTKEKVQRFKKTGEKVMVSYANLNIQELNKITQKIMNRAFQITKLKITQSSSENYAMELTCKW
jgi:hypothetical protein